MLALRERRELPEVMNGASVWACRGLNAAPHIVRIRKQLPRRGIFGRTDRLHVYK